MSLLRYIELKSGFGGRGPAWIEHVSLSRTKTTVYFNGRALKKAKSGGVSGNYLDVESNEEYWVSGVKKNGQDRQRAGAGQVLVEASALSEYLAFRGLSALNPATHSVTNDIVATNLEHFKALENLSYWDRMAENENA